MFGEIITIIPNALRATLASCIYKYYVRGKLLLLFRMLYEQQSLSLCYKIVYKSYLQDP